MLQSMPLHTRSDGAPDCGGRMLNWRQPRSGKPVKMGSKPASHPKLVPADSSTYKGLMHSNIHTQITHYQWDRVTIMETMTILVRFADNLCLPFGIRNLMLKRAASAQRYYELKNCKHNMRYPLYVNLKIIILQ